MKQWCLWRSLEAVCVSTHSHTHTMVAENHITADVWASVTAVYRGTEPRLRHHISFFWKALFIWRHVQLICDMGCSVMLLFSLWTWLVWLYCVCFMTHGFYIHCFCFFQIFVANALPLSARFLHSFLLNILTRSWIFIQAPPPPSCVKGQMCCERRPARIHPKIKNQCIFCLKKMKQSNAKMHFCIPHSQSYNAKKGHYFNVKIHLFK